MSFARGCRTGSSIGHDVHTAGSLSEGLIPCYLLRAGGNIVNDPMMEAARIRSIVIGHEQDEALRLRRHIRPLKRRSDIGAGTLGRDGFLRERSSVLEVRAGDRKWEKRCIRSACSA